MAMKQGNPTDLVEIVRDRPITTSLKVAEVFEKDHKHIIRDIRTLISDLGGVPKIGQTPYFRETTYIHSQNSQKYPMFEMDFDAFTLLAMGFTGKKALQFKLAYINAFNQMRAILEQRKDAEWQSVRKSTKSNCKKLGDTIRDVLIPLAKEQGSTHFNQLYQVYHKMINKAACVQAGQRDNLGVTHLHLIDQMEDIAAAKIRGLAKEGAGYKKINAEAKNTLDVFARIALITERFGKALINEPAKA